MRKEKRDLLSISSNSHESIIVRILIFIEHSLCAICSSMLFLLILIAEQWVDVFTLFKGEKTETKNLFWPTCHHQ